MLSVSRSSLFFLVCTSATFALVKGNNNNNNKENNNAAFRRYVSSKYEEQQQAGGDVMQTAETKHHPFIPGNSGDYEVNEHHRFMFPHEGELDPAETMGYMNSAGFGGGGLYHPGAFMGPAGIGGMGMGGMGMGGMGVGMGAMGMGHHMGGIGGEMIDKKAIIDTGKKAGGGTFEKAGGQMGQDFKEGQGGYTKGKVFLNNAQGNAGYEKQNAGEKKAIEDGKSYFGGQAFNQEGKNAGEKTGNAGHKKGHKIKGFKTTHHKDESGKTEEFYDEEHDEGSDMFHKNEKGAFGEKAGSAFKGGHDNGVFNAGEKGHQSNFKKEELQHKDKAEGGEFGANKYGGNQKAYGLNSGLDHHSLHELHEGNKMYKHMPYHVPFHSAVGRK